MALRIRRRWSTPFGSFVSAFGVRRLTLKLGERGQPVTPKAVHEWLAGRSAPTPARAVEIVTLSAGSVTLMDVYQHRETIRSR